MIRFLKGDSRKTKLCQSLQTSDLIPLKQPKNRSYSFFLKTFGPFGKHWFQKNSIRYAFNSQSGSVNSLSTSRVRAFR